MQYVLKKTVFQRRTSFFYKDAVADAFKWLHNERNNEDEECQTLFRHMDDTVCNKIDYDSEDSEKKWWW